MMTRNILATLAFAALFAAMAPTAHAQARNGGRAPVGHAVPAHPGGPGPSHPIYRGPGYGYGSRYYAYYPYYRYPYYPYYGGVGFSFGFGFGFGYGYPYYYPYYMRLSLTIRILTRAWSSPLYRLRRHRIDLPQKNAQVYTDGYLAGRVGDFNGSTERLLLTGGSHRIEIRGEGFAPLTVNVDIAPGRTIMYRADLRQPPSPPPQ